MRNDAAHGSRCRPVPDRPGPADSHAGAAALATPQSSATQQLVLGLDVSKAQVTAVEVATVTGPQLDQAMHDVLTSPQVFGLLTQAIPASQLEIAAGTFGLSLTMTQTYQPPNATIDNPRSLYNVQFDVTNIVVRPVNPAVPGPGALAIGIDVQVPGRIGADPS